MEIFNFIFIFISKIFSTEIFHSAVAFQQFHIYDFLNI